MSNGIETRHLDRRTQERYVQKGILDPKELEKHLKSLPDSAEKVLVDLQYKLLTAANPEAAYQAALQLGEEQAHEYSNAAGEKVRWKFVGLRDLVELGSSAPSHGTEVYSDLVRAEPDKLVMPKERLSVFWTEANKHKTARELLEDE